MHRRHFVCALAAGGGGFAGCTSGDGEDTENNEDTESNDVPSVSVTSEDYAVEEPMNIIDVRYATDAVAEFEPPDSYTHSPDSGNKYLLMHAEIAVETEFDQLDIYGTAVALRANGIITTGHSVSGQSSITQTVVSGTTYDGWTAFEIPMDTNEATLIPNDVSSWFRGATTLRFEADESLSVSFTE